MKLKFRKLQTSSELLTVEFGNRTETYAKDQFDDLLENGIEFEETDLGDKDINGIKIKTTVDGLEKIKDFKKGIEFYVEGKNILNESKNYYITNHLGDAYSGDNSYFVLENGLPIGMPENISATDTTIELLMEDGSIFTIPFLNDVGPDYSMMVGNCEELELYFHLTNGARSVSPGYNWLSVKGDGISTLTEPVPHIGVVKINNQIRLLKIKSLKIL